MLIFILITIAFAVDPQCNNLGDFKDGICYCYWPHYGPTCQGNSHVCNGLPMYDVNSCRGGVCNSLGVCECPPTTTTPDCFWNVSSGGYCTTQEQCNLPAGSCNTFTSEYGMILNTCYCNEKYVGANCEHGPNDGCYFYDTYAHGSGAGAHSCIDLHYTNNTSAGICVPNGDKGYCACAPGYQQMPFSEQCGPIISTNPCYDRGYSPYTIGRFVSPGVCECQPGFGGDDCSVLIHRNCSGHGHGSINTVQLNCICEGHWTGEFCELCMAGWKGPNCDQQDCYITENGLPCSGRGTCIGLDVCDCERSLGPDCVRCANGYRGANCSEFFCDSCIHGTCTGAQQCTCNTGWSGRWCDVCAPGYSGIGCNIYNCSNSAVQCSGHGICNTPTSCSCNVGWVGDLCQNKILTLSDCAHCVHGLDCENYIPGGIKCICAGNWDGDNCDVCPEGYGGVNCELFNCSMNSLPQCSGHGSCIAPRLCNCTHPFSGNLCENCNLDYAWLCNVTIASEVIDPLIISPTGWLWITVGGIALITLIVVCGTSIYIVLTAGISNIYKWALKL